jgi:hypothetical protein
MLFMSTLRFGERGSVGIRRIRVRIPFTSELGRYTFVSLIGKYVGDSPQSVISVMSGQDLDW